ncbi:tRNA adenosine(34) deaminase TadA [Aliamphritea hakodatensis]|uniref:tRNA adenosine(34) deaminase TadA n=1 Tax=Aliamphritea hakodatensis TaxID=2895352 RepID=UPI0022FD93A3|nr:tRNA adenosine(34) deaminase TadA [Aliamphritea hakodatensis]
MTTSEDDEKWMAYALKLADKAAEKGEVPVGAVVVRDGEVLGEGWNRPISGHDPCAHAEIIALRDAAANVANYRLVDATLYVTIEPCTMCAGAIIHSRVKRLVFGATEPKAGAVISNGQVLDQPWMNYRVEYQGGVMAERCSDCISAFFQQRREEKKAAKRAKQQAERTGGD